MLKFIQDGHIYESDINKEWISVTTLISQFHEKFDKIAQARKVSNKRSSKWYGMNPNDIVEIWDRETLRSTTLGTWYHDQREQESLASSTIIINDKIVPIIKPIYDGEIKIASSQKLSDGIYPEIMLFLNSVGLCGQSDRVDIIDGVVNIHDYKSNKSIDKESFTFYDGTKKMMFKPISHLQDCNYVHYNLQLSIYMYMILKHNPGLKPGKLTIHHVTFEEEGRDKFDYPIHKLVDGVPVVKDVIPYEMPYLRREVLLIMDWLMKNKIKKHD